MLKCTKTVHCYLGIPIICRVTCLIHNWTEKLNYRNLYYLIFSHRSKFYAFCDQVHVSFTAHLLLFKFLAELHVVGERPHGDGEFADDLQVNGPPVSRRDERVHPPVGGFRQQVDKRLQETNAKVLEVFRRLHFCRIGETHVTLRQKGEVWLLLKSVPRHGNKDRPK